MENIGITLPSDGERDKGYKLFSARIFDGKERYPETEGEVAKVVEWLLSYDRCVHSGKVDPKVG